MTVSMTDTLPKVEVITSVQRRRRWSAAEEVGMVEEIYAPGASVSLVARRHRVNPNQFFSWRRLAADEVVLVSEHQALQQQVREMHRLLGTKTLEAQPACRRCCHRPQCRHQLRCWPDAMSPGSLGWMGIADILLPAALGVGRQLRPLVHHAPSSAAEPLEPPTTSRFRLGKLILPFYA
jgi:transposase